MKINIFALAALSTFLLSGPLTLRAGDPIDSDNAPITFGTFTNPERVTIQGYTQDAMEPFVSLDGQYLFFNNSNAAPNTDLFYATRIDDLTFQFQGEIAGANTPTSLDAVASMDLNGKFYFVSTRSYTTTLSTIYWGDFASGSLSNVALVPGVSKLKPGWVNFDAGIRPDGNRLYFVDGFFGTGNFPQSAVITIAKRVGDHFVRLANSKTIMHKINTGGLNYAPCPTASDLEFFFTRLSNPITGPAIFTATRAKKSDPFRTPVPITAIAGFVEAPTISADGKSLYYHKKESGVFVIYRVTRP